MKKKTIISASSYIFLPHKLFKNENDIVRIKTPSSKSEYGHQTTSHATKRKLSIKKPLIKCKDNLNPREIWWFRCTREKKKLKVSVHYFWHIGHFTVETKKKYYFTVLICSESVYSHRSTANRGALVVSFITFLIKLILTTSLPAIVLVWINRLQVLKGLQSKHFSMKPSESVESVQELKLNGACHWIKRICIQAWILLSKCLFCCHFRENFLFACCFDRERKWREAWEKIQDTRSACAFIFSVYFEGESAWWREGVVFRAG